MVQMHIIKMKASTLSPSLSDYLVSFSLSIFPPQSPSLPPTLALNPFLLLLAEQACGSVTGRSCDG